MGHILLTGGSSGIGFEAAALLLQAGHRLTLPCRNAAQAAALAQRLRGPITTPICDLADLASVEQCAQALLAAAEPIDALVLNAGLQYSGSSTPRWSAQGFELTLAVNHLAHQALLQRLLPLLLLSPAARVVVTTSEVHDPSSPGGKVGRPAGLGDLAGLRQGPGAGLLDGSALFNAEKAYKDSKLCNLLMARELERRLREQGRPMPVLAWSPGLVIPRSSGGFFRDSRLNNPLARRSLPWWPETCCGSPQRPSGPGPCWPAWWRSPSRPPAASTTGATGCWGRAGCASRPVSPVLRPVATAWRGISGASAPRLPDWILAPASRPPEHRIGAGRGGSGISLQSRRNLDPGADSPLICGSSFDPPRLPATAFDRPDSDP
jgi:protochlorophyllide reductase